MVLPIIAAFAITLPGVFVPGAPEVHAGRLAVPEKTEPPTPPPGHRVIDLTPGSGSATGKLEPAVVKKHGNKEKAESKDRKKSNRIIIEIHKENED